MSENDEPGPRPSPAPPPRGEEEQGSNAAVFGVLFVIVLVVGAIFLVNRLKNAAALMDCAFTHAPACRSLLD